MLEEKLITKLEEISKCLFENNDMSGSQGVLAGEPGIALFLFYYSKFTKNETFSDAGLEILEKSVEIINSGYNLTSFCSGISGTAWVFDHLESKNFLEIDNDEFLTDLEVCFFEDMIKDIKSGNYDFLHNSLGIAYYFLNRYYNTKSIVLKNSYIEYIEKFVGELNLIAELDENSVKWKTKFDHEDGEIVYNLSLSHGMSSIINFLTRLSKIEKFSLQVNDILNKAVNFVLKYYTDINNSISLFPNIIKNNVNLNYNTRLAWCNGDLGIGLSLWKASKALKDIKFEKILKKFEVENKFVISIIDSKLKKDKNDFRNYLWNLLASYIHMHCNRLFNSKQRKNEWVLYDLLFQYYNSKIARMKYDTAKTKY